MENLLRDLGYGLKQLRKHPVFTLISATALGLGIASVTTQLSVTKGLFFEGLPFEESNRIAHLEWHSDRENGWSSEPNIRELEELRARQEVFESLAGFYNGTANFTYGETVLRFNGAFISANAFEILGVEAELGRGLKAEDDLAESPEVVVLSHKVWQRDFGGDETMVGKTGILNGRPVTIAGIMPEGFAFPLYEDIWIPLHKQVPPKTLTWESPGMGLDVYGRLKDGISFDQANAQLAVLARQLSEDFPNEPDQRRTLQAKPFADEFIGGETIPMALVMQLITVLILVIACANVANLLLARSMQRQREIAVRSALGATRSRIIHQFLTESILLAVLGAVIGIVMAYFNVNGIQSMMQELNTPFWVDVTLDWRVLIGVILLTLATGVLSGLIPAMRASQISEVAVLKDDTRTSSSLFLGKFSKTLVILQISVAAVILTLVVLFVRSMSNIIDLDYRYNVDDVISARVALFDDVYPTDAARRQFLETLARDLEALPEIDHVAFTTRYRFMGGEWISYENPERVYASGDERGFVRSQFVTEGFFETVQLPVIRGRGFAAQDFTGELPRVAIINQAFAEREWGDADPVGKYIKAGTGRGEIPFEEVPELEIIGVTHGMQEAMFFDKDDDGAAILLPRGTRFTATFNTLLARGKGDPRKLVPLLRKTVQLHDRNLPLYSVGTPRDLNDASLREFKFFSEVFLNFGFLATLLAGVGIYGVISFSVNQRLMEFGIRQALGSTRRGIFQLVYRHAFRQLLFGFLIAVGILSPILLSEGFRETLRMFFYGIDPNDLIPYLFSFAFVAVVALVAAAPPAYRASRIQPAQALRYE